MKCRPSAIKFLASSGLPILILLISLVFYTLYYNRGMMLADEGTLVHAAQRILNGQVPYRDFYQFYAPGRFYILSGLFRIFGESFLVSRMMWVVVRSACVLLVFLVGSRLMPKHFAILPAAVTMLVPGPWFKSFYGFSGLLSLLAIIRYVEKDTAARIMLAALSVCAALLLRQDVGLESAQILFLAIVLNNLAIPSEKRSWTKTAAYLAVAAITIITALLPIIIYFHTQSAIAPMLKQLFGLAPSYTLSKWNSLASRMAKTWVIDHFQLILFMVPFVTIFGGFANLVGRSRKNGFQKRDLQLLIIILMGTFMVIPAYLPASIIRLYQSASIIWIISAYLLWVGYRLVASALTIRLGPAWSSALLKAILYSAIVSIYAYSILNVLLVKRPHLQSKQYSGTITAHWRSDRPVMLRGEEIYLTARKARWIKSLVNYIQEHSAHDEPILVVPCQALLYYLCERPNPTRFIGTFTLKYADEYEDKAVWSEWVAEAKRARPRYIIVHSKFLSPRNKHYLKGFIKNNYVKKAKFNRFVVMAKRQGLK